MLKKQELKKLSFSRKKRRKRNIEVSKMENKYLELAKKLKALADRGQGGERYNAQKQLDRIMVKYDIRKEDLEEDQLFNIKFKFPRKDKDLFIQVALSVVGKNVNAYWEKTTLIMETTKLNEAEIRAKFNFYQRVYKDQLYLFFQAFIIKNKIFSSDGGGQQFEDLTDKQKEELLKVLAMSKSIEETEYVRQIT